MASEGTVHSSLSSFHSLFRRYCREEEREGEKDVTQHLAYDSGVFLT